LRHDELSIDIELREMPNWIEWMESELGSTDIDLPSAETCMDFVRAAILLAQRIRKASGHLPPPLRNQLIEAAILHQCWKRQSLSYGKNKHMHVSRIPMLEALEFVRHTVSTDYVMKMSDGNQYEVKFPSPQREFALATEVVFSVFARLMGISVPSLGLISVDARLAARAGIRSIQVASQLWSEKLDPSAGLHCLGIRSLDMLKLNEEGKPGFPSHPNTFSALVGVTLFNILALNTIQQRQSFKRLNSHAELVFIDFSHCAHGGDWRRFVEAKNRERITCGPLNEKIKSYEQLEPWIKRAEQVDLNQLCELAIKLPAQWYGNNPGLAVAVIEKLRHRILNLRGIILNLIDVGYFRNIGTQFAKSLSVANSSSITHEYRPGVRK
jgi:hypothetical protein